MIKDINDFTAMTDPYPYFRYEYSPEIEILIEPGPGFTWVAAYVKGRGENMLIFPKKRAATISKAIQYAKEIEKLLNTPKKEVETETLIDKEANIAFRKEFLGDI